MNQGNPFGGRGGFGFGGGPGGGLGGGLAGPVPRDLGVLLGIIFVTFSMQFFSALDWFPDLLRLTPAVWKNGFLWQVVTYPFVGFGPPNFWFLLELLILFMFGKDVLSRLGRRGFWRLLIVTSAVAGLVAVAVTLLGQLVGGAETLPSAMILMQGQRMLLTILIAAFATMNRSATILLFFVLPIQARWFLPLEIVFAFLGFLSTHDFAGFVGICVAVGFTFGWLTGWRRQDWVRSFRMQVQQAWLKLRLAWLRKRRGIHIVEKKDPSKKDPWLH